METTENKWALGEIATLPREEKLLMVSGSRSYSHYISSHYICIREETEGKRGILMKVIGKANIDRIKLVDGKPFGKDDREELFVGYNYFSYPFPNTNEVVEALDIIRGNLDLQRKFNESSMHINPDSTFWVNDTTRNLFLQRKLQYLGGRDGQLYPARDDGEHYRVTFVYFYKGSLYW
ncbi:MAG: hypothetical protein IJ580_07955 [Prevotella sp.]|nr:hypothetical protein [Prevotella sp.]